MKAVFAHWPEIARQIRRAPALFIGLDYDGVLSPIVRDPHRAVLSPSARRQLRSLAVSPEVTVAVISGRSLKDVEKRVGVREISCAGNHGLAIHLRGRTPITMIGRRFRPALEGARQALRRLARRYAGTWVEDKGLGLSFHYRRVPASRRSRLLIEFNRFSRTLPAVLRVFPEKMGLDIRPNVRWTKGSAALKIWRTMAPRAVPLYIGDDWTDEHVFRALRKHGLTIRVGSSVHSEARYYLRASRDVWTFLRKVQELQRGRE